jgi:hypothetical protein
MAAALVAPPATIKAVSKQVVRRDMICIGNTAPVYSCDLALTLLSRSQHDNTST